MEKNKLPKITVCIPTFNRANYLKDSIKSVLSQTYKDFELIVCNDFSSDNTEEVVLSFKDSRLKYIKNPRNLGYINSMNKCTQLARGTWILHLSDDDIMQPTFLETFAKAINQFKGKDIGMVVSQVNLINSKGDTIRYTPKKLKNIGPFLYLAPGEFLPNYTLYGRLIKGKYRFNTSFPSTLFNKDKFKKLGKSSNKVPVAHDLLISSKMSLKYPVVVIDTPLLNYRIHENWGSSLNRKGSFIPETLKYFSLLEEFVEKEDIELPYDLSSYLHTSLSKYLTSIDGGIIRLSARFKGTYFQKVKEIMYSFFISVKYNYRVVFNPLSWVILFTALLIPQSLLLYSARKMHKI